MPKLSPPGAAARFAHLARRAQLHSWGVADQSLSSLTNLALSLLVARRAGPAQFGAFALAFTTYVLLLGIARAVASEPLAIRFSGAGRDVQREAARAATAVSLVLGSLSAFGLLGAGAVLEGSVREAVLAIGLVMPGLLLQDAWRFVFFTQGMGRKAFVNDAVWTIALGVALTTAYVGGWRSAGALILTWGLAGNIAAAFGVIQARLWPAPRLVWRWLVDQRSLGAKLLGEFAVLGGTAQVLVYAIAFVSSVAVVGALKAGQILLGPLNVIFTGVQLTAVPESVRTLRESPSRFFANLRDLSISLSATAAVWGILAVILGRSFGPAILGKTWHAAEPVILPWSIYMVVLGATSGAVIGIRATGAIGRSIRVRSIMNVPTVVAALTGGAIANAEGAAWGLTGALILESAWLWQQFLGVFRDYKAATSGLEVNSD